MTRALKGHVLQDSRFAFPFRMILAGSSESGKTHFAGRLLEGQDLFEDKITAVFYYYPCYLSEVPVTWHKTLTIPVSYHIGLPTKKELANLPKRSCIVLDDSFDEAIKSSAIDHLFRVISGKKKICVIIMTQNNFTKGKYGREIRNSCNYSVLFRNCCDVSINENIARMIGLKMAFQAVSIAIEGDKYPYIFLDQSQKGQLTRFRLYTDIFGEYKVSWSLDGMKAYIVGAQDFELFFKVFSEGSEFSARENVDSKSEKISKSTVTNTEMQRKSDQQNEIENFTKSDTKHQSCITESIVQNSNESSTSCIQDVNESTSDSNSSEHGEEEIIKADDNTSKSEPTESPAAAPDTTDDHIERTETTRPIRRERFFRRQRFRRII